MKIDPIHHFNEQGLSYLTETHLHAEIERLKEENETLRRRVSSQAQRLLLLFNEEDDEPFELDDEDETEEALR